VGANLAFTFDDAVAQMATAPLGHAARCKRLADSTERIAHHPGGTLPEKFHDLSAYRATLRLMNHRSVTHAAILQPHVEATLQLIRARSTPVLIVHDTTELDYSGQKTLESLGTIGNGHGRGYECHNSIAVDPDSGALIGLVNQILHTRAVVPPKEGVKAKRKRPNRESRLWVRAVEQIGEAPASCHWINVCDRGADTFEFLEHEISQNRHFVIRSTHNRALETVEGQPGLLHDRMRSLPAMAGWQVNVCSNKDQEARVANVSACWEKVWVRAPHVHRGEHSDKSLEVWAIRVWEVNAPATVKTPLEWLLLTDEAIADATESRVRVSYYERRPRVEEFHKGQKTGMGIELLQLQSQSGLKPLIALLSVMAVALVNAREAARDPIQAEKPATEYFDPIWVMVLCLWRYRENRPLTVREYIMAVARLGGHLNRKCDGLPGWLTIWRGTMKLHAMVEYELARSTIGKL
jgi:hypothetical protein